MIGKNSMKRHYLKKKIFNSHLNVEDINDADYAHTKRFCKDFRGISSFVCSKQYIIVS